MTATAIKAQAVLLFIFTPRFVTSRRLTLRKRLGQVLEQWGCHGARTRNRRTNVQSPKNDRDPTPRVESERLVQIFSATCRNRGLSLSSFQTAACVASKVGGQPRWSLVGQGFGGTR